MVNCDNCKVEMTERKLITQAIPGLEPYISIKQTLGFEKRIKVTCYVCTTCGKVELRAANLKDLK